MTECGLTNLGSCIAEKLVGYLVSILNQPLQLLLDTIKYFMTQPVDISLFKEIWIIIIYCISLFYGLFIMFAGFNIMLSGHDPAKRERAKQWIKNIVLMIFFVQASFFIYSLVIELSTLMTAGVYNLIDPNLFILSVDSNTMIGHQVLFYTPYSGILVSTVILFALRYLLVSMGVVFFPIGLFFFFIPFLKSYGKLIINVLGIVIFLPFFHSIILLCTAKLMELPVFENLKIVAMMSAFSMIASSMIILVLFAVVKSVFAVVKSDVGRGATKIAGYFAGGPAGSAAASAATSASQTTLTQFGK